MTILRPTTIILAITLAALVVYVVLPKSRGGHKDTPAHGFDLSRHSIDIDEIVSGGPGKDDIPSLTEPEFVRAEDAAYLSDDDMVLGVFIAKDARAYPVRILNWHEAVNDTLAGVEVLATW